MALNYGDDPFRPADNWTECPKCKEAYGWNDEDNDGTVEGLDCSCGYTFKGDEPEATESKYHAVQTEIHKRDLEKCLDRKIE